MAFALFVALACTSLSKFVFRQEDYIVGSYTDFVISHDGEGQTSTRLGAFLEMLNTETDENTDRQEESHDE